MATKAPRRYCRICGRKLRPSEKSDICTPYITLVYPSGETDFSRSRRKPGRHENTELISYQR